MRKTTLATFGDNVLDFQLPDCWEKLTQEQLRYVCYVMSHFEAAKAKAYIFIRLLAIRVYRMGGYVQLRWSLNRKYVSSYGIIRYNAS